MKREIKFRAWCEGKHEDTTFTEPFMDYDITIQNGVYASVEGGWDIQKLYKSIPIMQYTDFKDKNGKMIYEGDILKGVSENSEVCFHRVSGYDARSKEEEAGLPLWAFHKPEIIGNIYEGVAQR